MEIKWQTETEEIVFKKEKNINYLELNVKSSDGFLENLGSKKQLIKHPSRCLVPFTVKAGEVSETYTQIVGS